jgi:hypothetical protein
MQKLLNLQYAYLESQRRLLCLLSTYYCVELAVT